MAVATAILAGAAIAGSITSAKIQSNAAKDAAKTQAAAGDKSLAFQRDQMAAQQKAFQPYQQAGQGAATNLSNLMAPGGSLSTGFDQPFVPPGATKPTYSPTPQNLGSMMQPQPGGMPQQPQSQPQAGGEMWSIKAPDGSVRQFPPPIAQHYMQQGLQRVA